MGGSSLRHSLTVSRRGCWTPGWSLKGGQEAPTKTPSGMSAFLSPSEQAVHLWDVGYIHITWFFSVYVDCLSTQLWDNQSSGMIWALVAFVC